ncbi:protein serine/threonine phosphatase 2C [Dacryopinax primogenitus]|uniref:Protein serine/threonine phosphatase 2C n=1 Tax=Dacryopinax primogenitus (strain DJM 731) TaxID=1858805 RepID=M5GGZ0_DACPD|nr:protein serine/threonine phosphatase 2C [Dacryopinax primogenitus]EJU06323.1 protein serine/threonine phosphatase 2C [Dacryopinax primogenitus]
MFRAWVRIDSKTREFRSFPLLPHSAVHELLNAHVRSSSLVLRGGKKWSWNVAQVSSNEPCEDGHAEMIISRDEPSAKETGKDKGEMLYFAVMDGHAGPWTSELLQKTLIPTVALEMDALMKGLPSPLLPPKSTFLNISPLLPSFLRTDGTAQPALVEQALRRAYTQLDRTIVSSALALLDLPKDKRPAVVAPFLRPGLSGSCALLSVLDTQHEEVHLALVGDCRAVAGYWDEGGKRWVCEVLTEDQTAKAVKEVERLKKEHPGEEEMVARNGRVLGGLEPSRAFGDARYKWTKDQQDRINRELISPPDVLRTPPAFQTPPYVTADPVVTHRPFRIPLTTTGGNPSVQDKIPTAQLRFLILATDGLWDALSPMEAVTIASTHLSQTHAGTFPQSTSPPIQGAAGVDGKGPGMHEPDKSAETWVYDQRDTPAVCLIRNALGSTPDQVRRMLSLRAPYSRRERDDMTVSVIWWEEGKDEEVAKAKL